MVQVQSVLNISHGGITAAASVTVEEELDVDGKKTVLTQVLSTSLADIEIGDITWTDGTFMMLTNRSSTTGEDIKIAKNGEEIGLILPGEAWGPIRIIGDGTAYRAKSATGTPTMQVVMAGPLA